MAASAISPLNMGSNKIIALLDGTSNGDAINLGQLNAIFSANKSVVGLWDFSGGALLKDSTTYFYDDGDATKQMRFQLSGITASTTRNLTVPDADGTIALLSDIPSTSGFVAVGGNTLGSALSLGTNDSFDTNILYNGGTVASFGAGGLFSVFGSSGTTNSTDDVVLLQNTSSGTPTTNYGLSVLFRLESTTTNSRDAGRIKVLWTTATDASRTSAFDINPVISGSEVNMYRFGSTGLLVRDTSGSNTLTLSSGGIAATQAITIGAAGNSMTLGGSTGIVAMTTSSSSSSAIQIDATNASGSIRVGATSNTSTSLAKTLVTFQDSYTAASGSGTYTALSINNIFNLTGTASGVQRGIYINPILTSLVGTASYRAVDIAVNATNAYGIYQSGSNTVNNFAGNTGIGTTGTPAQTLHVQGTMRLTGSVATTGTGVLAVDASGDVTNAGVLPPSLGGTGISSLTANRVPYGNGTSAFQSSNNFTFNGSQLSLAGGAVAQIKSTTSGSSVNSYRITGTTTSTANNLTFNGFYHDGSFSNDGSVTGNNWSFFNFSATMSGSTAGTVHGYNGSITVSTPNINTLYGQKLAVTISPASGSPTSTVFGSRVDVTKNTNTDDTYTMYGLFGKLADFSSTGRINIGQGISYTVESAKTGYGINMYLSSKKGSSGNTQYGIQVTNVSDGSGVVVDNVYGINMVQTLANSGAITNYYGIRFSSTPSATTNYIIYAPNAGWRGYVNGSLSLGVDSVGAQFTVRGTGNTSSSITALFENSSGTDSLAIRDDNKVSFFNASYNEVFNVVGTIRTDSGGFVTKSNGDAQSTTGASAVRLWNDTASTGRVWYVESRNDGKFGISNGDSSTRWLSILASGKIGVNKETPAFDFEVGGEIAGRHVIGNATSNPTNTLGTSSVVGTGASCFVVGNDVGMNVALSTGTGVSASGTIVTITYNLAYATAPAVAPCPKNAATAAAFKNSEIWLETTSTTVVLKSTNNLPSSTSLNFDIITIGRLSA